MHSHAPYGIVLYILFIVIRIDKITKLISKPFLSFVPPNDCYFILTIMCNII